jgi:GntR family transcriptional regulator
MERATSKPSQRDHRPAERDGVRTARTPPPAGDSPILLPRYASVANDLIGRIAAGEFPVGSLLPKEFELAATYGVSRHTMREALRRLDEAGLLSRRRRAGTEIVAAHPLNSYRQPISSIDDFLQYGEATEIRRKRQKVVRCDETLARLIGCQPGSKWLRVESIRTQDGDRRPICHTTLYLTMELDNIEAHIKAHSGPVSAMVEDVYGIRIAEIEQSIEAISLDVISARHLDSEPGYPALKAVRRYYDDARRLIELAVALHPGERFVYTTRLLRR